MNKIILVLSSLLLFANFSFAQNNVAQNNLSVFSEDGLPFYLVLNGIRQNENPETNVRVDGLTQDFFAAKVIFNDQTLGEIEKKYLAVTTPDCKPCDVTYKIKYGKKGELVLKPFSFSSLATAPPPPPNVAVVHYNTAPMPAPNLGVQVTETRTTHTVGTSDNVNVGMSVGGVNMGVNVNVNDGFGGTTQTSTTTTTTTTSTMSSQGTTPVFQNTCPTMNEGNFNSLLNSIQQKGFGEDKLAVAKQATGPNCLTVNQITRVMDVLTWEEYKLDYAKHAYAYCVDQQNYFQVNDAFDWDDSTTELNNYIAR